jgi:hypothetical protein
VQAAFAAQWQTRFEDLLADHPDAEADLAAIDRGAEALPHVPLGRPEFRYIELSYKDCP